MISDQGGGDEAERRAARTLRRMARGALAGRSPVAQPVQPRPVYRDIILPRGGAALSKFLVFGSTFDDDSDLITLSDDAGVAKVIKFDTIYVLDDEWTCAPGDNVVYPDRAGTFLIGATIRLVDTFDGGTDTVQVSVSAMDTQTTVGPIDSAIVPDLFGHQGAPSRIVQTFDPLLPFEGFGAYVALTAPAGFNASREMELLDCWCWGVRLDDVGYPIPEG